jgi:hypothetical protein
MDNLREKAHQLIESMPDEKLAQVVVILERIVSIIDDEVDEWDLKLIKDAREALNDADFIPFEDVLREAGLSVNDILRYR